MIFAYICIGIIFWPIVAFSPNVSVDFPLIYQEMLVSGFNMPFAWSFKTASGLGISNVFVLWSWPADFLYGLLGKIGLNFELIQIILGFAPVVLIGTYSLNLILKEYKVSKKPRIAATLVFLSNSYILLLLDGGQLMIALAYSMLPLSYFYFYKSLSSKLSTKLAAGVLISALGFTDIRFVYLLLIILATRFVFDVTKKGANLYSWISTSLLVSVIFLMLHFFWIYPFLKTGLEIPASLSSSSNIKFLSFTKLKHGLLLLQPHWFKNSFGVVSPLRREFLLIPFAAFLSPLLHRKHKEVGFWLIISLLGVFLAKGSNAPFQEIYPWLFKNIPGFFMFRDPSKFFALVALSYSILIGFTLNKVTKKSPWIFGVFLIYIIFLARPVYLGKMTGLFSNPPNKDSFQNVAKMLKADNSFGRVLWIPSRHPLAFVSLTHPVVEANRISSLKPFAMGNFGTYETLNFLREADYMGQLMNLSSVKYIVYPYPDTRKKELSKDEIKYYDTFSHQLAALDWLTEEYRDDAVVVFKVHGDVEKFFIAENKINLHDSTEIFSQFNLESKYELKNNALVFNEERLPSSIYLSDSLENYPNKDGWWKRDAQDFAWVRNFLQEKYGIDNQGLTLNGGYAFCEGFCKISVPGKSGEYYIRVLLSDKGGKVGEINTKIINPEIVEKRITGYGEIKDQIFEYSKGNFEWFSISGADLENLEVEGDVNVINAISEYLPEENEVEIGTTSFEGNVNFEMINPSHYKVVVKGLSKPSVLVFSETFSSQWRLDEKNAFKVYSLFNGFDVSEDGEYNLYYDPQKYVNIGLAISLVSLCIIIYLWKKSRK